MNRLILALQNFAIVAKRVGSIVRRTQYPSTEIPPPV